MSLSNTASNLLIRGSSIGAQLALVPIAITTLGPDTYGLWMVATAVAAIATAFDLGTLNAAFNIAARSSNRRAADLCAFAAARRAAGIVAALLLLLTAVVMTIDVSSILNTKQPVGAARLLVLLVCTASLLTLPFAVFNQLSLGRMQASRIAPILILANVGGFIAAWIASQFSASPLLFVACALLPALLAQVHVAMRTLAYDVRLPRRSLRAPLVRARRRIRSQGSPFFVAQIATLGSFHIDNLIIATMLSSAQAAEYSLANRYFSIISILISVYLSTAWPVYAGLARAGDSSALRESFKRNLSFSIAVAVVLAGLLFTVRQPFFEAWTRGTVAPGDDLMLVLGIFSIITAALGNISALFNAIGRLRLQALVTALMLLPNVLLSVLMVREFGVTGTVAASAICASTMLVIYSWHWTRTGYSLR